MSFPIVRVTLPADLVGQDNGNLDPSLLRDVGPRPGWKMHHLAARCWEAMRAAAKRDGIVLSYSGNPYRDLAGQTALFRSRYTTAGPTAIDSRGRSWNGERWYRHTGAPAAVPGTSNHGLGLAVDIALDADGDEAFEWPPKSLDRRAIDWLLANADRFGFSWELQSEPWHLRMVTGDAVPQAVLDHERGTVPAPVQPPAPQPAPTPTTGRTYVVKRGDSYWRIALRTLGAGSRWHEIATLNGNRALHPGQTIQLPGSDVAPAPAPAPTPAAPVVYVVKRGDSYWRIAATRLGNGARWGEISKLNNNRSLHPGDRIQIPPR